jgi:putative endonuclease
MKDERSYYVYIITNKRNGTLYIGVTNSLFRRSNDHREKRNKKSFTSKYNIKKLVYYEIYQYVKDAIAREKQLKNWQRKWKIELIEEDNPTWRDLYNDMQ